MESTNEPTLATKNTRRMLGMLFYKITVIRDSEKGFSP